MAFAFCFAAFSLHRAKTLPFASAFAAFGSGGGPPGFGTGAAGFTFAFAAGEPEAFPDIPNLIAAWTKPWA